MSAINDLIKSARPTLDVTLNMLYDCNIYVETYQSKVVDGYFTKGFINYFNRNIVIFRLKSYCSNVYIKPVIIVLYEGCPIIHTSRLNVTQINYLYHFINFKP